MKFPVDHMQFVSSWWTTNWSRHIEGALCCKQSLRAGPVLLSSPSAFTSASNPHTCQPDIWHSYIHMGAGGLQWKCAVNTVCVCVCYRCHRLYVQKWRFWMGRLKKKICHLCVCQTLLSKATCITLKVYNSYAFFRYLTYDLGVANDILDCSSYRISFQTKTIWSVFNLFMSLNLYILKYEKCIKMQIFKDLNLTNKAIYLIKNND